ncbi:MAG: ABC transporter permease subunit [Sedimentisphaerales bacterium]|nr:ABC transporter permease subunit [Sedimentisphaerales bacterium]
MIWILIRKEIQETIVDSRFWIASVLCVLLVPLGLYVSLKNYEQRLESYQTSNQQYVRHSRGRIDANFKAKGYRPPSPLSVFSGGLKDLLNYKITTTRTGNLEIESELDSTNLQAVLFGKIDFAYIVTTVLSILAFIFTFSSVTGEREMGTLRLILANATPRSSIILAKIIGSYLVFLAPFALSVLIGLLVLSTSRVFSFGSGGIPQMVAIMLFITSLFMFCIFCLGVLVSTLTHRSLVSMIVVLLIWVIWALIVPKISPMIAQIVYPIQSPQVVEAQKQMARENLQNELTAKKSDLFKSKLAGVQKMMTDGGAQPNGNQWQKSAIEAKQAFDQEKVPLEREYEKRIDEAVRLVENAYVNKQRIQTIIAVNLSRLSPICCLTYALSELAGTGTLEMQSFMRKAQQFQEQVQDAVYDNFEIMEIPTGPRGGMNVAYAKDGIDPNSIQVPQLSGYQHTTLSEALQTSWVDIVLLALFSILFFVGAYVKFLKYDVR